MAMAGEVLSMDVVERLAVADWSGPFAPELQRRATAAKLPTIEELYSMPLEDLQALVYRTR